MRAWKTEDGRLLIELDGVYHLADQTGLTRRIYEPADLYTMNGTRFLECGKPVLEGLTEVNPEDVPPAASIRRLRDTDFWREEQERESERLRSPAQLPELADEGGLDVLLVPQQLMLYLVANGLILWEESSIGCGPGAVLRIERIVREKYGNRVRGFRSLLIYE